MRTTFLIGRLTPKSTEMVVVKSTRRQNPFPGPWTLRAMVRPRLQEPMDTPFEATVH